MPARRTARIYERFIASLVSPGKTWPLRLRGSARVRVQHDMEELVSVGLTPLEAITAATWTGARLLGVSERTGRIAVGLEADLVVLDRDPLTDFRVVYEPLIVVSNGDVVLNRYFPNPYDDEPR